MTHFQHSPEKIRLQKWISMLGLASRREAEKWISEGRLTLDGKPLELGSKVDPATDKVFLDGKLLPRTRPPLVYWLLNKPDKTLTTRRDDLGRRTIYDLPALAELKFLVTSVGRLDFRTEGLLLITNDGELTARLTHPRYQVPRYYQVQIDEKLTPEEEQKIRLGFDLDDGPTGKIELRSAGGKKLGQSRGGWYFVTVREGRNRFVRRIFEAMSREVVRLVRYGYGDLRLEENAPPGAYRQLRADEIRKLKQLVGLTDKEEPR